MLFDYDELLGKIGDAPTLLLGNGFSIAYSLDFQYDRLRELAPLPDELDAAFDDLETTNFEDLLRWFTVSGRILERLGLAGGIRDDFAQHEQHVRQAMIQALTLANPRSFADMSPGEIGFAKSFISHFKHIFALSYDLLLYWLITNAKMKDAFFPQGGGAFRWSSTAVCEVYWLHGGFHLYEQASATYKVVQRGGAEKALLEKIEENINFGIIPLIVAEGKPEQKRTAIARNDYLTAALERLTSIEGTIVTFGASFRQDAHILDAIVRGRANRLFVGVHGQPERERFVAQNGDIAAARDRWTDAGRLPVRPLDVVFWDTSQHAIVWGRPPIQRTPF